MSDASAYQATGSIKSAEIEANTQKSAQKAENLHALARAIAHLRKQTERGEHAPYHEEQE